MKRTTLVLSAITAAALLIAGCAEEGNGATDPAGAPSGDTPAGSTGTATMGMGPGLSVPEAESSELDGPLLVNGFIVASGGEIRLCELLAESFPPQCGGASLIVEGLDLERVDGLKQEGDVSWTDSEIQVLGGVEDGRIVVSSTAQG